MSYIYSMKQNMDFTRYYYNPGSYDVRVSWRVKNMMNLHFYMLNV